MSVSKNKRRGGSYEVRWREGGRRMSRTFARKADAEAFDLDTRRRKQVGALAPSVIESKQTLAAFLEEEWWPRYAIPNLASDTRRRYLEIWGKHLLPRVGGYGLRDITPRVVEELRSQLDQTTGAPTARKALMLLQAIMRRAVVHGLVPINPVQVVAKPKQKPTIRPQPLDPLTIERIRMQLRPRDEMIVSLLAYAGLRPSEDPGHMLGRHRGPNASRPSVEDRPSPGRRAARPVGSGPVGVAAHLWPAGGRRS